MSLPTLYLPDGVLQWGSLKLEPLWNTVLTGSPTGQTQSRSMWPYSKRGISFVSYVVDGTTYIPPPAVTFAAFRQFLTQIKGMATVFYIFNPKSQTFDHALDVRETNCGASTGALPMTCPFKGGTITAIYKNGVLSSSTFTVDAGGPGGETRIVTMSIPPTTGQVISVNVTGAYERIPVRFTSDRIPIDLDWSAADPPVQFSLSMVEEWVFG